MVDNKILVDLLRQAADELRVMRNRNALQSAKLEGIEIARQFLFASPRVERGIGEGEDLLWKIEMVLQNALSTNT